MESQFARTEILIGKAALERLAASRVAVFGIGGVGGYVCEALVRAGIGAFDLIDNDTVSLSNLNRQLIALHSTIGQYKVDVMQRRMLDINPAVKVQTHRCFFLPENADTFSFSDYDYVVDAVDTVTAKLALVERCHAAGVPVISSMGTGNKLGCGHFVVADIFETTVCPLAKVMRRELKKRGIEALKVVYSQEQPIKPVSAKKAEEAEAACEKRAVPGSISFVPPMAGLLLAGEVVRDLCGGDAEDAGKAAAREGDFTRQR